MSDASPFMTTAEAAELLRTTPGAIRHLVERGRMPGVRRFGRRILIRRSAVLSSMTEACMPSPQHEEKAR
jgi:excisionase family DNA binding protein